MDKDTSIMKILQIIKRRGKNFLIVLFILLVFTLGFVLFNNSNFTGVTAKIMIGHEAEEQTGEYNKITGEPIYEEVIKFGNSSISEEAIVFYTEVLKSPNVLEKLIKMLDLDYSMEELSNAISIKVPENSSTMLITMGSKDIENPNEIIEELVLLFKQEAADITENDKIKIMNINDEPRVIESDGFTRKIVASIVVSVFIAGAVVLVIEYLDDSIHSATDIEERLSIYVIGKIKSEKTLEEDLKAIRTNFEYSNQLKNKKIYTLASLDEYSDNISVDFFRVLKQLNNKALLVDANLRNPEVHGKLDLSNEIGLSNILNSKASTENVLQTIKNSENKILTAGSELSNPSEQLSSRKMKKLLAKLSESFDYIIINGHPITEVTDTLALATATDGVVLVVEQNRTKMNDLLHVKKLLADIDVDLLGVIYSQI